MSEARKNISVATATALNIGCDGSVDTTNGHTNASAHIAAIVKRKKYRRNFIWTDKIIVGMIARVNLPLSPDNPALDNHVFCKPSDSNDSQHCIAKFIG